MATAIKIGNPASWKLAVNAANESKGFIDSVTDDEILEAYSMLAKVEGIFAEPASAASLAGISTVSILPHLYYPFALGLMVALSIIFQFPKRYH